KVGHGTADVIVRDPIAITASGPRFLTLGDEARLEIDLHNVEGVASPLHLTVDQENAAGVRLTILEREVHLAVSERKSEHVTIKPNEIGRFIYDIRVTGAGDLDVRRRLGFEVKPPAGDIRRVTVSKLAPNATLRL